jgi:excisionase family DNA binding protein
MIDATRLLTPRDLADVIGASESSVRRWVDAGQIQLSRTLGGHRRIPLHEAIRFIRLTGAPILRPDVLGLAPLAPPVAPTDDAPADATTADRLFDALSRADRDRARSLVVAQYLRGDSVVALFDGPLREAMSRIGQLWQHSAAGIMIEHHALDILLYVVAELRALLPPVPHEHAPLAVGGAPEEDPYVLPSMMAAVVLADAGFRDVNFGARTPLTLLASEALARRARLVWVSVSYAGDPPAVKRSITQLGRAVAKEGIDLVVGGQALRALGLRASKDVHIATSMADLAARANEIRRSANGGSRG